MVGIEKLQPHPARTLPHRRASFALRLKEVSLEPKQPILTGYDLAKARDDEPELTRATASCEQVGWSRGVGGPSKVKDAPSGVQTNLQQA